MQKRAIFFPLVAVAVAVALRVLLPTPSLAIPPDDPEKSGGQAGENRWVPSLAITGGAIFQEQKGSSESLLFEDLGPDPVALQPAVAGDDLAVAPFVGGSLELMTPALPIPTRPRLFISGEILPTFASERTLATEGDPSCVSGPEPGAICAVDEVLGDRRFAFGETAANGVGTATRAEIDTLAYGARLGVAFPLQVRKRQLRIKPAVGWIHYKVDATGSVVNADCDPVTRCTDVQSPFGIVFNGFLRQPEELAASASQRFNGIGPVLDIEMDAARLGSLGVSLFMGGGAYRVLGDRKIAFGTTETYDDQIGNDLAVAKYEVEVDPWIFLAQVGIRFHWLGWGN